MAHDLNIVALVVFAFFFVVVTVIGFFAARWRRGDLGKLDEWGLGGRQFGTIVTWFLVGGDFYTAYTVIAVPALVFGQGAFGFFALPYTIVVYPIVFLIMPRLWAVSKRHGYVTPADFINGRYGSRPLVLAVALTGLLATMPYIALQLIGMQVVIAAMGVTGDTWLAQDLPLIIAFIILAAYTYSSGLRAPALIALVKDTMIYIMVLAAVIIIPIELGGYDHIFDLANEALSHRTPARSIILPEASFSAYATLALGSAMAAFMYPHTITGVLSSASGGVIKRNAVLLPAYTFLLGLIALLGYMAIAIGVKPSSPNFAVPDLFLAAFPSWFAGFAFAAIAIGALVPAAIMSIAAANLFTRNVYREFINPKCGHADEAKVAKLVSLVVKLGALGFILFLPTKFSIDLQLLGGCWILQTFPALVFGLFTRRLHSAALLIGWAAGMASGTWLAFANELKSVYTLSIGDFHFTAYIGLYGFALNLLLAIVLTPICDRLGLARGQDQTEPHHYDLTAAEKA
jgi:SSS family solute:Na+ symporter